MIGETEYRGLAAVKMENEVLRAVFLPDYGSKMVSLLHKRTGREILFQPSETELELPYYGADYAAWDASGFDELFPSIDASFYPEEPWRGQYIPDHGELWTLSWSADITPKGLEFRVQSPRFPYAIKKRVNLIDNLLQLEYRAFNQAQQPFKFIWAAHLLLASEKERISLLLPEEVEEVINVKRDEHLGAWGERHSYPLTGSQQTGESIDLSTMDASGCGSSQKFYALHPLQKGCCGVEFIDTGERLLYSFPPDRVPYLGVWKSQGGFRGDYNLALEPCTGAFDDLYLADKLDRVSAIPAQGSLSWYLQLRLEV